MSLLADFDHDLADRLNQGMDLGGTVELPFPVPYFWAVNGQKVLASIGGAQYFGGWACKAEQMDDVVQQVGGPALPFKKETIAPRDGEPFEAYTVRVLICAPISFRQSWLSGKVRHTEYVEGGRHHLQMLVFMGVRKDDKSPYDPWGPVVLSAKGYQARNLLDGFSAWKKHIEPARLKWAKSYPAWTFYAAVGTFGQERNQVMVGKTGAQSPITPIVPFLPKEVTEALLEKLFVGPEISAAMVEYMDRSKEWLAAWKREPSLDQFGQAPEQEFNAPPAEDEPPF